MLKRLAATAAAVLVCTFTAHPLRAQQTDSAQLAQLRKQVEALAREIEAMKLGEDVVVRADTSSYGLGPAASKVYRARPGFSLGGYGEFLLQKPEAGETTVDALRAILYAGYKFTPTIVFNSEIEFEHATTEAGGSVSVEFAYLDWVASPKLGVRAGMLLVPMGLINELHEPPVYLGVRRPLTETNLIPTTWRENGVGVFGDLGGLSYRAYLINGFDALGGRFDEVEGFSAGGLRDARQSGARARFKSPAVVARVDYNVPSALGASIGGSAYYGNSVQYGADPEFDAATNIIELHAQYRAKGLDLRALFATASIDNVAQLNEAHGYTGNRSIGERLTGWYVQGGYDLLRSANSAQQLIPYVRYEKLNTQASVPTGFQANPSNDRTLTTLGAMWKPITNIAVKADYQLISNQADTGVNQLNVSLGYLF